jgi:hypothetical protein
MQEIRGTQRILNAPCTYTYRHGTKRIGKRSRECTSPSLQNPNEIQLTGEHNCACTTLENLWISSSAWTAHVVINKAHHSAEERSVNRTKIRHFLTNLGYGFKFKWGPRTLMVVYVVLEQCWFSAISSRSLNGWLQLCAPSKSPPDLLVRTSEIQITRLSPHDFSQFQHNFWLILQCTHFQKEKVSLGDSPWDLPY